MDVSREEFDLAEKRMAALRAGGYATSARYDHDSGRVLVELNTGIQVAFPAHRVDELLDAAPADLGEIEISAAGLGLHWPRLDVDLYVPALLQGVFGERRSIAARLGASGGKVRSGAKTLAARENGRKGGRPRKVAG